MKKLLRIFTGMIALLLTAAVVAGAVWHNEIYRFYKVVTLFDEGQIVENFRNTSSIFPYHLVKKADPVYQFDRKPQELPETFLYRGKTYDLFQLLEETWTTGFIVIKDDIIRYESYHLGHSEDKLHISWSVGKSFVSALVGIAMEEGHIPDLDRSVSDYVPRLAGTGYDGVPLKDVLQMSTGVLFDENYADFHSDINRMGRTIALGSSINEFAASLTSQRKSGEFHHYVSMDTQVLGMVLKETTGVAPATYLEEKIWKKIGMESDARWLCDDDDMELVFGTLNVTLRDYARFGRLYMNGGRWNGRQIVPAAWIKASTTPDAPHLMPGENPLSTSRMGYGYQWWIPENPDDDFLALGVHGQFIYINPKRRVVIVKNSADPFWRSGSETNYAMVAGLQHIARSL